MQFNCSGPEELCRRPPEIISFQGEEIPRRSNRAVAALLYSFPLGFVLCSSMALFSQLSNGKACPFWPFVSCVRSCKRGRAGGRNCVLAAFIVDVHMFLPS